MWDHTEKPAYEALLNAKDVKFFVDGECVSPSVVLEVAEESNYMADYVIGKEGRIAEVRFDRVDQV
ncbi:MAG: hypothetical protein IKS85_09910 [Lachnospiraceae bacterium]|nr:hypothetical protein [Lachnospiraceae bacterium]